MNNLTYSEAQTYFEQLTKYHNELKTFSHFIISGEPFPLDYLESFLADIKSKLKTPFLLLQHYNAAYIDNNADTWLKQAEGAFIIMLKPANRKQQVLAELLETAEGYATDILAYMLYNYKQTGKQKRAYIDLNDYQLEPIGEVAGFYGVRVDFTIVNSVWERLQYQSAKFTFSTDSNLNPLTFENVLTYFKSIAEAHTSLKSFSHYHISAEPFPKAYLESFLADIRSHIKPPFMLLEHYIADFSDNDADTWLKQAEGAFIIMDKLNSRKDSDIKAILGNTESIAEDIIGFILHNFKQPENVSRAYVELNDFTIQPIGEISGFMGVRVDFTLQLSDRSQLEYDATKFTFPGIGEQQIETDNLIQ